MNVGVDATTKVINSVTSLRMRDRSVLSYIESLVVERIKMNPWVGFQGV